MEASKEGGPDLLHPIVGRGLAVGDVDNDGRVDVLVVDIEGHALLLHNQAPTPNHWLSLKLVGTKSNRDGIGAHLTVEAGGKKWRQVVSTTGSFMSASDVRAHLGLGTAARADRIEIRWPSGHKTIVKDVPADQFLTVEEDRGIMPSARGEK